MTHTVTYSGDSDEGILMILKIGSRGYKIHSFPPKTVSLKRQTVPAIISIIIIRRRE